MKTGIETTGSKHTPGPWRTNHNIGRKSELGITADAAPCIIATMANAKEWPAEARANARLIAAAPEMFEALQGALSDGGDFVGWEKKARLAIAKATGEGA